MRKTLLLRTVFLLWGPSFAWGMSWTFTDKEGLYFGRFDAASNVRDDGIITLDEVSNLTFNWPSHGNIQFNPK